MRETADDKRRRDDVAKIKKHVSLTPHAVEKIKAYSLEHNVSFSAAMECLALIGLEDDLAHTVIPILTSSVHKSVNSSFNRIAKIASFGAIEAATTREMVRAVLKLALLNQQHIIFGGDDIEKQMRTSDDHPVTLLLKKLTDIARYKGYRRLRSPLDQVEEILNAEDMSREEIARVEKLNFR